MNETNPVVGRQFEQLSLFDTPAPEPAEEPKEEPKPAGPTCWDCYQPMQPTGSKPRLRRGQPPRFEWSCARHGSVWTTHRPPKK